MIFSYYSDSQVCDDKSGYLGKFSGRLEGNSFNEINNILLNYHTCASIFKDDYRKNDNFIEAHAIVFDFDSGINKLEDIKKQCMGLRHLIYASKNHLIDKNDGKGAIERFHIYFFLDKPITTIELYKFIWKRFEKHNNWTLDKSCCTPTKYFYKHKKLLGGDNTKITLNVDTYVKLLELHNRNLEESRIKKEKLLKKLEKRFNGNLQRIQEKSINTYMENNGVPTRGNIHSWFSRFCSFAYGVLKINEDELTTLVEKIRMDNGLGPISKNNKDIIIWCTKNIKRDNYG